MKNDVVISVCEFSTKIGNCKKLAVIFLVLSFDVRILEVGCRGYADGDEIMLTMRCGMRELSFEVRILERGSRGCVDGDEVMLTMGYGMHIPTIGTRYVTLFHAWILIKTKVNAPKFENCSDYEK